MFIQSSNPLVVGLILVGTVLMGATALYSISQFGRTQETVTPAEAAPKINKITALGRIEPKSEVISLAAPLSLDSDRVAQLLVEEGDRVKVGQAIAILDSRDRLEDALQVAREQVRVAQARLAQVKAGAKTGEIDAQQATLRRLQAQWEGERATQQAALLRLEAQVAGDIAAQKATIQKLEAEYNNAQAEYRRYQQLKAEGAIAESFYDSKRLVVDTSRQQLEEARVTLVRIERMGQQQLKEASVTLERIDSTGRQQIAEGKGTLEKVAEIRPVDVQAAQTEVDAAIASADKAKTELNQAYIRSPISGQVIKIHTRPGEQISDSGIVDLAETAQMEVIAEIYQTDISKIQLGQAAIITGDSFTGQLRGKVRLIGLQVNRQNVFSNQPGENLDRKVIEVRLSLNPQDSQKVAGLTNSQVQVAIQP